MDKVVTFSHPLQNVRRRGIYQIVSDEPSIFRGDSLDSDDAAQFAGPSGLYEILALSAVGGPFAATGLRSLGCAGAHMDRC